MPSTVSSIATVLAAALVSGCASGREPIDYYGQTPPGNVPVLFAPGRISLAGRLERVAAFSPDGDELFFTVTTPDWRPIIMHAEKRDGRWSEPDTAFFAREFASTEPSFSPDGRHLFFASTRPPGSPPWNADLWMIERTGADWSAPIHLGPAVNSDRSDYHPSVAASGTLYFASTRGTGDGVGNIYRSRWVDGAYLPAEKLGDAINSGSQDWDPYISPDERLLIFKSNRPGGYGDMDLYACVRGADGEWLPAENLGPGVNTAAHEDVGALSPDGRFFFFARRTGDEMDIYWVDAGFLERLGP